MEARRSRRAWGIAALTTTALALGAAPGWAANDVLDPEAELYVNFASSTVEAARGLSGQEQADALLLASIPSATWLTQGTPAEVEQQASTLVTQAQAQGEVPTLVAYNVPFRDCAQYSAGGATSPEEYEAWIDGVAAGIGDAEAVVILEPDGLGIIPHYTTIDGETEWCQPAEVDAATAADERFAMLNYAVDELTALPSTAVYLDGTHSGWLSVGDVSDRLIKAGVTRADGFFLNASNYVETERLLKYGTWISECIHLDQGSWWERSWCGSQYYPASPDDFSTWELTDASYDDAYADTGLERDPAAMPHFVIDTSRNGQGPWTAPADADYPDPEVWCNPPGRGLGERPTTDTGDPLVDAFLWIKIPGESDGQCTRGTEGPEDPERGMVDPPAGSWFPEQARELIELAVPAVEPPACEVTYTVHGTWPSGFNTQVWVENTGDATIDGWDLRFALDGGRSIDDHWSSAVTQAGSVVTAENLSWNARLTPGKRTTFGFIGSGDATAGTDPLLFLLDGKACTLG